MKMIFSLLVGALTFTMSANAGPGDLDYFRQFIHQHEIDNSDPETPVESFRTVMSQWNQKVPRADGTKLNYTINLYLFEDFRFVAFYKENVFPAAEDGSFRPAGCQRVEGQWSVPDDKLILPGLGFASKSTSNSQNAMSIVVEQQLISPESVNQPTLATLGFSNFGLDREFCF